jgi:hypothetical protein
MSERGNEIRTYRQNLAVQRFEFANTRLVGSEFLGSATCKCGREERQNDDLLAAIIRKLDVLAAGVHAAGNREVRREVADFEGSLRRCLLLRK